jgi:DNA-binding MarR family transcriptional regulator
MSMLLNSDFYELTQDFQGALFQGGMALLENGAPPVSTNAVLQLRRGYAESPAWFLVLAQEFDPEPLSVERIRVRAVWSSERIVAALLDLMASEKWLDRVGAEYHLTDDGRAVIQGLTERRHTILAPLITHLAADEVEPLERLMRRVLDASSEHPSPPGTWSLAHSRNRMPNDDAPTVHKLFQYCADFNAYRDDSHMAAFQPLGVEAYAWEAFSHIWRGTANTAQAIFDILPHRGYSRTEFAEGLRHIAERAWIKTDDGEMYQMTDEGRKIRQEVERLTNEYFFGAWSCLSESEIEEVHQRMSDLKVKLEGMGK